MVRRRQTEVLNAIDSQNSPKGTAATERCNAKACFGLFWRARKGNLQVLPYVVRHVLTQIDLPERLFKLNGYLIFCRMTPVRVMVKFVFMMLLCIFFKCNRNFCRMKPLVA